MEETLFLDAPPVDSDASTLGTTLLVVDDLIHLMRRKDFSEIMQRIFTTLSHHQNITCFFITQSAFADKSFTTLHRNARYLMLTKSHHDYSSLSRTYMPGTGGYLRLAAQKCFYTLNKPYLIVDNNCWVPPDYRCKTGFAKGEEKLIFAPANLLLYYGYWR